MHCSVFTVLSAAIFASIVVTAEVQTKHAGVELLPQQTGLRVGQENLLGVHLRWKQGWHIYWINSGQPPVFQRQLPEGSSAGAVQWPRPQKLRSTRVTDFGYNEGLMKKSNYATA